MLPVARRFRARSRRQQATTEHAIRLISALAGGDYRDLFAADNEHADAAVESHIA